MINTIFFIIAAFVLFAQQNRIRRADSKRSYDHHENFNNQRPDKMNHDALKVAYDLFVTEGYEGAIEEFSSLLSSNPEALKDSYSLFQREGYEQPIEYYEVLVGVKKTYMSVLDSDSEADSDYIATVKSAILFSILVF